MLGRRPNTTAAAGTGSHGPVLGELRGSVRFTDRCLHGPAPRCRAASEEVKHVQEQEDCHRGGDSPAGDLDDR